MKSPPQWETLSGLLNPLFQLDNNSAPFYHPVKIGNGAALLQIISALADLHQWVG